MIRQSPPQLSTGLMLARTRAARSVTMDTVRDDCRAEALALVEAGFVGAELPSPFVESLRGPSGADDGLWHELRDLFLEAGLSNLTVHGPNLPTLETSLVEATDRAVWHARVARELGAASIVVHPTAHSHPHVCSVLPHLLERDASIARAVGAVLAGSSTKLALENLPTYGIAYLIRLMDQVADPQVGVCFDTGHWNVRPERNIAEVLAVLGPRIVHLHLSDNDGLCDQHLPPGAGNFDWVAFLNHLPEAVCDQPWLIELDPPDPAVATDFDAALNQLAGVRRDALQTASDTLSRAAEAVAADVTIQPCSTGGSL